MAIVEGTLAKIDPPNYQDSYGNHYQNLVVQTTAGPIQGRKASKTPYAAPNDLNRQVKFEGQQVQSNRGTYIKFTRPQEPQYQQQAQQLQNAIDGKPDWDAIAEGKVRHGLVCAYLSAGAEPTIEQLNYWKEYVMTGRAPMPPAVNTGSSAMPQEEPWEH